MQSVSSATDRFPWRFLAWGMAATLLVAPVVAMRFSREVQWTLGDFVVFGVMLAVPLLVFELVLRRPAGIAYRAGAAVGLAAGFLLVWINLAVGMIGDEGDPANWLFALVLATATGGAAVAKGDPRKLRWTMAVAAGVQLTIAVVAVLVGWGRGNPVWPLDVLGSGGVVAAVWLAAAGLFALAER